MKTQEADVYTFITAYTPSERSSMSLLLFLAGLFLAFLTSGCAGYRGSYPAEEIAAANNRSGVISPSAAITSIKNSLDNCYVEISQLQEKSQHLEEVIAELRQEQASLGENKGLPSSVEKRMAALETATENLTADVRQIKNQSNSAVSTLGQYRQNLADVEKTAEASRENVRNLESAMRSMMEMVQQGRGATAVKDVPSANEIASADKPVPVTTGKIYKVKAGDTLEKIAKSNGTTVQEIKRINHLQKEDLIFPGQELRIP